MKELEADNHAPVTEPQESGHGHGRWMMVACCVPILLIAGIAVLAGAGWGFLLIAAMCTVMMVAMMAGMSHGTRGGKEEER